MSSTRPAHTLARVIGAVPGALLGAAAGVGAAVRRTKPLHPRGRVGDGVLHVLAPRPELGVPLLAEAGDRSCVVRWSRAMGLPAPLPDFEGLALRFADEQGGGDVLLASTGTGRVDRHLLLLRSPGQHGPQSTLLPVESAAGPLLLCATPADDGHPPERFRVAVAVGSGDWQDVAALTVAWGSDVPMRFDPVERQLPGTRQYPLVTTLRQPAYRLARWFASAR
jgi:hypothetical protein